MMIRSILIVLSFFAFQSFAEEWDQKADFGGIPRHRTCMISIGNKIYAGLGHYNGAGINVLFDDWWEYDPATNAWTQKADYMGGICYHAAAFTIGAYGYVGTGRISPSGSTLVKSFYRYDPQTNTWLQIADFPGTGRRGACAFTTNGYGYVGSGETTIGRTTDFYRYNPAANSWISIANFPGTARTSAVAFDIGDYGYVGTGDTDLGSINDFWRYNPAANSWEARADVGPYNRQEAMAFALNGVGYIGTGVDYEGGNNFGDMWEYTPATDSWIQISDFEGSARRYLSGVAHNGDGYAGLGTNGTNFNDFWIFDQTASLLERNIENITITAFPNPASTFFSVKIEGIDQYIISELEIQLIDVLGRKVIESSPVDTPFLSLDGLKSGVHFVVITYKGQIVKQTKLIVEK